VDKIIALTVERVDEGYEISYNGMPSPDRVPADALDVPALVAFAGDAAGGYVTSSVVQARGDELFRFLIGDRPWAAPFRQELERSEGVHIRLEIEVDELRPVPWELLYDKDSDAFLALMPQVRLSRVGSSQAALRDVERPIQMVILTTDVLRTDKDAEADAIWEVLSPVQRDGIVYAREVRCRLHGDLPWPGECDVLHVSGRLGELCGHLEQLLDICRKSRPQVVFLGASRGRMVLDERIHLMWSLQHDARVPVVVGPYAMTSRRSTVVLAQEFYRGMVNQLSTQVAVARARRSMAPRPFRVAQRFQEFDWAGLVLYQSQDDGPSWGGLVRGVPAGTSGGAAETEEVLAGTAMDEWIDDPTAVGLGTELEVDAGRPQARGPGQALEAETWDAMAAPEAYAADLAPKHQDRLLEDLRAFLQGHVSEEATLDMLRAALHADEIERRVDAVRALGLLGQGQQPAREELIDLVADWQSETADALLRREAVAQLGYIHDQAALDALLGALADPDASVRREAYRALFRASEEAGAEPPLVRRKLPLTSAQASEWVSELRQYVSSVLDLAPRKRIEAMEQVEALRLELIYPRPRPAKIETLLRDLGSWSAEVQRLAVEVKEKIEVSAPTEASPPSEVSAAVDASADAGDGEGGEP
jgi:hypothetical protein